LNIYFLIQHGKSLGRNPLSGAPYQNLGMVLNEQEPDRHPLGGMPYLNLDTVLNEQGLCHHILNDALHRRPDVVKNEQESSYLTRRMRVGSLTDKLRKVVDTMIKRRVNILYVQETIWKG
jgi:hypothetical protein